MGLGGVWMRSMLEGRWSIMFTTLGWDWTYEPVVSLRSYVADFGIVEPTNIPPPQNQLQWIKNVHTDAASFLVEIKPGCPTIEENRACLHCPKMMDAGVSGVLVMLTEWIYPLDSNFKQCHSKRASHVALGSSFDFDKGKEGMLLLVACPSCYGAVPVLVDAPVPREPGEVVSLRCRCAHEFDYSVERGMGGDHVARALALYNNARTEVPLWGQRSKEAGLSACLLPDDRVDFTDHAPFTPKDPGILAGRVLGIPAQAHVNVLSSTGDVVGKLSLRKDVVKDLNKDGHQSITIDIRTSCPHPLPQQKRRKR